MEVASSGVRPPREGFGVCSQPKAFCWFAKTSPARPDSVMNLPGGTVSNSRFDGVVATLRTSPQIYAYFSSFTSRPERRERRSINLEFLPGIESGRVGETSAADR